MKRFSLLILAVFVASAAAALAVDFPGLGDRSRKVTTTSVEAQRAFDQGLAFLFAFNHDEAIRSFKRASDLDPNCAMAYWGIAIANGPHINFPAVPEDRATAAWAAITRAKALTPSASALEEALIAALSSRYADPQPPDRRPLDEAYANAMRDVWKLNPRDGDVGALFAEALMDLRPWDLWTADGKPQPETPEIVKTLEDVMARDPKHPLALHLYIHAVEASPDPGRADRASDTLRDLLPGLGHLVHMPSHIDVRRGRWTAAITANTKAMASDAQYRALSQKQGFYRVYMAHNHHMLAYAAMMTGRSKLALDTIRAMTAAIPAEFLKENPFADGFMIMPLEVLLRFGRWDEVLAEPALPDYVPLSRTLQHYARAVAYAAKGNTASAQKEQEAFAEARKAVPKDLTFGNNTAADILDLADSFMRGEILYRAGIREDGLAALREAVTREDKLRYDEPPDWIQPVRHALGAALLQAGRPAEAEKVFREDLATRPDNGWSLYGLYRALQLQKKKAEAKATEKRFDAVWKEADVKIKSPCLCLPGV